MAIQRQHTNRCMSHSVSHQGTIYLSRQVTDSVDGDIEQQTLATL